MPISQRIASYMEKGSWIRKMFEEGTRLKAQYGEDRVFDFSIGNPPEEPPEAFQQEFRRLAEKPIPGMHRYMPNAGFPAGWCPSLFIRLQSCKGCTSHSLGLRQEQMVILKLVVNPCIVKLLE